MCVQAVLTALSDELLCVNTELRQLYDAYSSRQGQAPWGWGRPEHSAALTSAQMWELMRDCGVPDPDCQLADINLALSKVNTGHQNSTRSPRLFCLANSWQAQMQMTEEVQTGHHAVTIGHKLGLSTPSCHTLSLAGSRTSFSSTSPGCC